MVTTSNVAPTSAEARILATPGTATLRYEEYTVGWICALPVELASAQEMLDEEHEDLERDDNENLYSLGSIGGQSVVIGAGERALSKKQAP